MLNRIGQITRDLHENLRDLGYDALVNQVARQIPDARDRLAYVAHMTEQAANRVLTATDVALPLQERIGTGAAAVAERWSAVLRDPDLSPGCRAAAEGTIAYLGQTQSDAAGTRAQLMEIMMAQDFQDLTGQVIKRVTDIAQNIEQQLVQLLIDYSPQDAKRQPPESLMNGPQIGPAGGDVVANQGQVDDLLESLGF